MGREGSRSGSTEMEFTRWISCRALVAIRRSSATACWREEQYQQ